MYILYGEREGQVRIISCKKLANKIISRLANCEFLFGFDDYICMYNPSIVDEIIARQNFSTGQDRTPLVMAVGTI
jgi:hypothetical protein